jgi:hypothetical protein
MNYATMPLPIEDSMNFLFSNKAWHFYHVCLVAVAVLAFLAVFCWAAIFNPQGLRGVK